MENNHQTDRLFEKYLSNQCTDQEIKYLLMYFGLQRNENALKELILRELNKPDPTIQDGDQTVQHAINEVHASLSAHIQHSKKQHPKIRLQTNHPLIQLAVTIIILLSVTLFFYLKKQQVNQHTNKNTAGYVPTNIAPGRDKATLTLADGTKIELDTAGEGVLAAQAGITIRKTAQQVTYDISAASTAGAPSSFNIIETPKGGQYQINLPDGTRVWLNAASTLRFPTTFKDHERTVEISGEAYFEVVENKNSPFKVISGNQTIEVLGTQFNINAYNDEGSMETTLVKGSVKISSNGQTSIIKPGEQASVRTGENYPISIKKIDPETVIAWKNGYFYFNETDLFSLMKQISRWYNIEVVYEKQVKNELFVGKIERSAELSKVLRILELGGIHCKLADRKLIVTP